MEGFLQTALSFPTVLFSFLLILAIIYWGIAGGSPCNMARRCWKTAAPG